MPPLLSPVRPDAPAPASDTALQRRLGLKHRLVLVDLLAATVGWGGVLLLHGGAAQPAATVTSALGAIVVNLALIAAHNLYLARVCSVRAAELTGLARSVLMTSLLLIAAERILPLSMASHEPWLAAGAAFAVLALARASYAGWLRRHRSAGRYVRDLVLVGTDADTVKIASVIRDHPELGYRVRGFIGDVALADEIGGRHLGPVTDARGIVEAVAETGVTGVVLIASALPTDALNEAVRRLPRLGVHTHLSSGVRGIAHQRFRPTPFAYEPLFYVEPVRLAPWQVACKRLLDVIGASAAVVVTAPLVLAAMVAIRLDSPGPVLFRQPRVGRNGRTFTFVKLRTMVADADKLRVDLEAANQRREGPLFKAANDPRVTRVGRVLRATSLDELPQLWNVLAGSMSLVGPRPALPSEVAQFDEQLRARTSVPPGLTGLWQIEARDNPAFGPYRRLDLFYVENWSPLLDLSILCMTLSRVMSRARHSGRAALRVERTTSIVLD